MVARNRRIKFSRETDNVKPDPPQTCSVSGKRMYANERDANSAANHQMSHRETASPQLRTYRCIYCGAWHLTSKQK
jgi:hypothetical protein